MNKVHNLDDIIKQRLNLQSVKRNLKIFKLFGVQHIQTIQDFYNQKENIKNLDEKNKRKLICELVGKVNLNAALKEIEN